MSVIKRGPILILVVILIVVLVGGGGLALLGTKFENDRVQNEVNDLNAATSDLTSLGALSNISGKGWISAGLGSEQILSILKGLRDHKCCVLESDFAVPALETLSHIQVVLAEEKLHIDDMTLASDTPKALQTAMVNAYGANEQLVRDVSQVILDWSQTFGDEKREGRIKAMEDATQVGLVAYTDAQEKIDFQIGQTRSQQDVVSTRLNVLKTSQTELKTRSYLFLSALALGLVLFVVLLVMLIRLRKAPQPVIVERLQARRAPKKKRS
jgi:hypothetical protein